MGGRQTRTFVRAYNRDAMARLQERLIGFSDDSLNRASARALAGASRKVQPLAKADIRERYGVKATALNGKFRAVSGKSRKGEPYLGIWASSRQISLIDFGGRWRKKSAGATAAVRVGEQKTYSSAFIAIVKGRKAIRVRSYTNGPGSKRHGRGPLVMLRGPSPFEMLLGADMRNGPKVADKLLDFYVTEFHRQMNLARKKL